ncbi:protein FAM24B-like [Phoca vitulina]|uniref:protein FAM24B-like n=1 Tax=Phoca vitulina TaxID=9720 RepID=UPI0013965DFA|nr:protein FAM24B-like [Phoca vitulina]
MFCIGGGILVAILVLMGVVICLYYKISDALKLALGLNFTDTPDNCDQWTEKKNSNPMLCVCLFLRPSKAPLCLALKSNPAMLTQDKVAAAAALTTGSYPNVQCCDECSLYADYDPLPPCFCDVNEGL